MNKKYGCVMDSVNNTVYNTKTDLKIPYDGYRNNDFGGKHEARIQ